MTPELVRDVFWQLSSSPLVPNPLGVDLCCGFRSRGYIFGASRLDLCRGGTYFDIRMMHSMRIDRDQLRFMENDMVILLNADDEEIGKASKMQSHRITAENPRAMLHRAFSVFMFNDKGELLIQKRARSKMTFPREWANTCCSHPLSIPEEREVDEALGVRRAARRKLKHELGILPEEVPLESLRFIKRIRYSALADSRWAENEIDYILFCRDRPVTLDINPGEVEEARYVSASELKEEMAAGEVVFTPWFRLIADRYLFRWWQDLDTVQEGQTGIEDFGHA